MSAAAVAASGAEGQAARRRLWLGSAGLALFIAAGAAAFFGRHPPTPLPVLYPLPAFALVDERGQALGSAQLAGRPYVADFIYTRCHDSCPLLTQRMAELSRRIEGLPVALVSFTVDPTHDTSEVLASYARAAGADPARWRFLTGPAAVLAPLLQDGFKVPMEAENGAVAKAASPDVLHDNHFVIVDGQGRIRGYYPAVDEGLEHIRRDLKRLVRGE